MRKRVSKLLYHILKLVLD